MDIFNHDPKIIGLALLGGIIPSLLWLWFWLKEEENPEPKAILTIVFIMGIIAVLVVLPIQQFIQSKVSSHEIELILWAASEEMVKFFAVLLVLYKSSYNKKPIDWPIFMITAALGFAALENTLFLIKPFSVSQATVALLTGQLRFMGSTLLHTISSGVIGISLGIALNMNALKKTWHLFIGFFIAITLHSAFNFFIIRNNGSDFLKVFAFLWVVTIVIMLLFEKVRRMSEDTTTLINN